MSLQVESVKALMPKIQVNQPSCEHYVPWAVNPKGITYGELQANGMSSGISDDAFRRSCGPARIYDVDCIIRVYRHTVCLDTTRSSFADQIEPVPLAISMI